MCGGHTVYRKFTAPFVVGDFQALTGGNARFGNDGSV